MRGQAEMMDAESFAALNLELVDHMVSTPLPPKIEGVFYGEVEVCVPAVSWSNEGGRQPSAVKVSAARLGYTDSCMILCCRSG